MFSVVENTKQVRNKFNLIFKYLKNVSMRMNVLENFLRRNLVSLALFIIYILQLGLNTITAVTFNQLQITN